MSAEHLHAHAEVNKIELEANGIWLMLMVVREYVVVVVVDSCSRVKKLKATSSLQCRNSQTLHILIIITRIVRPCDVVGYSHAGCKNQKLYNSIQVLEFAQVQSFQRTLYNNKIENSTPPKAIELKPR